MRKVFSYVCIWYQVCMIIFPTEFLDDKKRVSTKKGVPGHFGAKNRYILKPSTNHARSPAIGQPHIVPVFGYKRPGTPGFVYFVLLSTVFGEF